MPYTASTFTVNDVMKDVKRSFGDEAGVQITDEDIIRWTNRAQLELFSTQHINRSIATTNLIVSQSAYDVAHLNILKIQSIHVKRTKLKFVSFQEAEEYIIGNNPASIDAIGTPTVWTEWGGKVYLHPASDSDLEDGMTIYYLPYPTKVTIGADALSVPDVYYNRLVEWVTAQALEMDEDQQGSQFKLGQFTRGVDALSEDQNVPQFDYYPTITVLPEDE